MSQKKSNSNKKPVFNSRTKWSAPNFTLFPEHFGFTQIQIDNDREGVIEGMRERLSEVRDYILSSGAKVHMCSIVHSEDTKSGSAENIMTPSLEKPHVHLLFVGDNTVRMSFYLGLLAKHGIAYRLDPADKLNDISFINSGEAVQQTRDVCAFIVYLTHETRDALADADKTIYDVSELITTYSPEEVSEFHYRYKTGQRKPLKRSERNDELQSYCNMATSAGYSLDIDFDDWFNEYIPPVDRSSCKVLCRDAYEQGFNKAVEELRNNYTRACIYIKGAPATGKTATTINALTSLGMHPISITKGSKTGATDNYKPCYNKALVYNDTRVHDILNTCDNSISSMYRRNSGNRFNLSKYVVVTSNLSFDEYLQTYDAYKPEELEACRSRFFICYVDDLGYMKLVSHPTRCSGLQQDEQNALFAAFCKAYNDDRHSYISDKEPCLDSDAKKRAITALCDCPYSMNKYCGHSLLCSSCSSCPAYISPLKLIGPVRYDFITVARSLYKTNAEFASSICSDLYDRYFAEGVKNYV